MTDLSGFASVGFKVKPATSGKPKNDVTLTFKRAGRAGSTRTQRFLRRKSPVRRPEWFQELQNNRVSWKHATTHQARLYNVSLVLNPPNPNCTIQEVKNG